jgi:hypothetical protein
LSLWIVCDHPAAHRVVATAVISAMLPSRLSAERHSIPFGRAL